jgi:hypothetical protein
MSSDVNNNGFEKLIRDKFEDYRTSVDPHNWDAIEKSLVRSRRVKYIYTATGIVAAAVVLLLITLNLPRKDNQQNGNQTPEVSQNSTPAITQSDNRQNAVSASSDGQTFQETTTSDNQTKQKQSVSTSAQTYSVATTAVAVQTEKPDMYPENPPVKDRLIIVPKTVSGTSISISALDKLQLTKDMRFTGTLSSTHAGKNSDNLVRQDNKKDLTAHLDKSAPDNKKWSVSVSFGAGNYQAPNVDGKNSDLVMAAPLLTSSNSVDYIRNKYRDEIKVPDNADSQHGLPLSAKFIIRKDLNNKWAVESGLSYTYLSTKYKWNTNTVNQQLHYLGIPLNAVYYAVSKPGWNIYASVGGMVEKGVYARIKRNDNITAKSNMNGLQWSVNGAIGATYKLRKGLGLFFEPQFGYFFDNGQPESIRSEWPVSFSLSAGLRFNF